MPGKLMADPDLCVNCRMCEMVCSLTKASVFNPSKARIWIDRREGGSLVQVHHCRHCVVAPCVKACPVQEPKPIWREPASGIVRLESQRCIGCCECLRACPFGAVRFDPQEERAFKCDLCGGDPECVKWCPTGAIRFVDIKAMGTWRARSKGLGGLRSSQGE